MFNYGVRAAFDTLYSVSPSGISVASEPVYSILKKTVLSFNQPFYNQGVFIGSCSRALGLNLVEKRSWCKYLAPSVPRYPSRFSFLKRTVSEGCTECGACSSVCQGNAAPDEKEKWKDTECLYCWNCDDVCPANAVSFGFRGKRPLPLGPGRRREVTAALSGMVAVPLLRLNPLTTANAKNPVLLRPPGSL